MKRLKKRYEISKYAGSRLERKPGMQVGSLNFILNSLGNHCRILNREAGANILLFKRLF